MIKLYFNDVDVTNACNERLTICHAFYLTAVNGVTIFYAIRAPLIALRRLTSSCPPLVSCVPSFECVASSRAKFLVCMLPTDGLIFAVIPVLQIIESACHYFHSFSHLASALSNVLSGLWETKVVAPWKKPKLFYVMIFIFIYAEVLTLHVITLALILTCEASTVML